MKKLLLYILQTSRPRFWIYIVGPFIIGMAFAYSSQDKDILQWRNFALFLYFLFPFNFLLYSVNDFFDRDTDKTNAKKVTQESYFKPQHTNVFLSLWFIIGLITIFISIFTLNNLARIWFMLLVGTSLFYSVPPFNFKRRAYIDSLSNIFYIFPGYIAYALYSKDFNFFIFLVLSCWPIAMHLYSAIPDIDSDRKVGIKTTAVVFGEKISLIICFLLWFIFVLGLLYINIIFSPLIIYALIPFISLLGISPVSRFYWYFPLINIVMGFVYFWVILIL